MNEIYSYDCKQRASSVILNVDNPGDPYHERHWLGDPSSAVMSLVNVVAIACVSEG